MKSTVYMEQVMAAKIKEHGIKSTGIAYAGLEDMDAVVTFPYRALGK